MSHEVSNLVKKVAITYDASIPCIDLIIAGYVTSSQYRQILEELLSRQLKYGVNKVFVDITHMPIIGAADQQWFLENWLPRAAKENHQIRAVIYPQYYFNRIAISSIANKVDKNLATFRLFDDKNEAKQWLKAYTVTLHSRH